LRFLYDFEVVNTGRGQPNEFIAMTIKLLYNLPVKKAIFFRVSACLGNSKPQSLRKYFVVSESFLTFS